MKINLTKRKILKSKQPIDLNLVDTKKIVLSDQFENNDKSFKYFIGYKDDNIVRQLCIILHQMSGYMKYLKNGGKNMSFIIKDDSVLIKYKKIWNKIKESKNIKFRRMPVHDETYIKAKVR